MAIQQITVSGAALYYGTDAEVLAYSANTGDVGLGIDVATLTLTEYTNTSAGGSGTTWTITRKSKNGAIHVSSSTSDTPLTFIKYADATYEYFCEAAIASARSDSVWKVFRKTIATDDIVYAGTGLFAHAATDLATVAALTYTLGA